MSRDINDCRGTRWRGVNEVTITNVRGAICCPELGTDIICTSCFCIVQDLVQHRSRYCSDFNAHVKLHNGYLRQFQQGMAGPHVIQEYILTGEIYRLVRNTYGLPAFWICRQADGWGPYDGIVVPDGIQRPAWSPNPNNSVTYDDLVRQLMPRLPPTIRVPPRPDPRMTALSIAFSRPHDHSYTHECHAADELTDMRAVARFVAAHGQVRAFIEHWPLYNCPDWGRTNIHRAEYPPAAGGLVTPAVWMSLAPPGQGVAGFGDTGIAGTNQNHHAHVFGAALGGAHPPGQVNPYQFYQGVPAGQVGGVFNMPGTPRR